MRGGKKKGIKKHFNLQKIAKHFRTRSPVSAADVDGWRARELMAPLFMGDDEELQALIRDHLILPYLFGDFHSATCSTPGARLADSKGIRSR